MDRLDQSSLSTTGGRRLAHVLMNTPPNYESTDDMTAQILYLNLEAVSVPPYFTPQKHIRHAYLAT
jgi:hypothetical protein